LNSEDENGQNTKPEKKSLLSIPTLEISPEREEEISEKLIRIVKQYGLEVPVLLFVNLYNH
jgi:hypothetical protein